VGPLGAREIGSIAFFALAAVLLLAKRLK
jgi:hypothetical protein